MINTCVYDNGRYHLDMDKTEFTAIQATIGCTGTQLARWLDVKPLTITRYRTGANDIPGPVAVAMKALATGWRP
jgi:hypothetical protein